MILQRIVTNLTGLVRHDKMEGRDYLVVPMVMMTEGVHAGSNGPLLYPSDELAKFPEVWNHKPVVVYHPEKDGRGVSACDPVILTTRKVGVVMNTAYKNGKLTAEAWIDEQRAKEVDLRVLEAIERNEVMELSTGLFTENEDKEGEWRGEAYRAIARNYKPDHLALLPDKIGACSIADGAGFLRLNEAQLKDPAVQRAMAQAVSRMAHRSGLILHEMSFQEITQLLYQMLVDKFGLNDKPMPVWVEDVFDSDFVYSKDGTFFRQGYTIKDGKASLTGLPTEVRRVTDWKAADGVARNAAQPPHQESSSMNREQRVNQLIVNKKFDESDRKSLMEMPDGLFDKVVKNAEDPVPETTTTLPPATTPAPAAPAANAKQTPEQFIAQAPPEMRGMLQNGLVAYNAERDRLIAVITANSKNRFTKEQLTTKELGELQALAELATPTAPAANGSAAPAYTPSFLGAAGAPQTNAAPVKEEPLPGPVFNFEKK